MSITRLTVHTHTSKRSYDEYTHDQYPSHDEDRRSKRNNRGGHAHDVGRSYPSDVLARPLIPNHDPRKKASNAFNSVVTPPSTQRGSLLAYRVRPYSQIGSSHKEKESVPDLESGSDVSRSSTSECELQKMGIASFTTPKPLSNEEVQKIICRLFIEMAQRVLPEDPQVMTIVKSALKLNPIHEPVRQRLLLTLGNAYLIKAESSETDLDSVNAAINTFKEGCTLKNISKGHKALFSLNLGKAYLMRKYSGDADKAITCFEDGLKLEESDFKLIAELHRGKSDAFMQKAKLSSSASTPSSSSSSSSLSSSSSEETQLRR